MNLFKQSTAASRIVGPILDSAGVEYASAVIGDLSISKNGGTLTALAAAATLTYIANGMYTLALTTGNTDTAGAVQVTCNKSTYQMPPHIGTVLVATVFDAIVTNATTAVGGLGDVQRINGQTASAAGTVTFPGTVASSTNITAGTITTVTNLTNAPTAGDLTATMKTSVTTAASAATPAVTVSDKTGFSLSTAGILAIWHQLTSAIVTASTIGKLLVDNINATVSSRMATYTQPTGFLAATFPGTVASTTNITGGTITTTTNVTTVNGLAANVITAASMAADASAEIADQVWDEVLSGHLTAGTTGAALNGAGSAGDPWLTLIPGSYTAGQAGYIVGTNLDGTVSTRATQTSVNTIDDFLDTEVAAIKAKTDLIPTAPAAVGDIPTAAQNATAVLTTAMTESYAANGATFTMAQGMYAIHQYLTSFAITTVNYSVKKLDGTTEAFVVVLNDATTPTGATR